MTINKLFKDIEEAINRLYGYSSKDVILIHHDDADGLSSGAILYKSLSDAGYNVKLVCIEKLMDQVIRYIHTTFKGKVIFYADIGSPHADVISRYNNSGSLVIILDHHDPSEATDKMVLNINPEFYGLEGEVDASGSVMAYLFSKYLDESNISLSKIALVGAQELPSQDGKLVKLVYEDVDKVGLDIDLKEMFKILQILGPVGYYEDGPKLGVKACLEGLTQDVMDKYRLLEERRRNANRRMLAILYRYGLRRGRYIQWFDSYNIYKGMGTKVIGSFCSYLSYQKRLVDQGKYIVGFMELPNIIPGLMELDGRWIKVSMRAPEKLRRLIELGEYPGIVDVLVDASEKVGGVGDGHKYAASAVIPYENRDSFLRKLDDAISMSLNK